MLAYKYPYTYCPPLYKTQAPSTSRLVLFLFFSVDPRCPVAQARGHSSIRQCDMLRPLGFASCHSGLAYGVYRRSGCAGGLNKGATALVQQGAHRSPYVHTHTHTKERFQPPIQPPQIITIFSPPGGQPVLCHNQSKGIHT